MVATSYLHTMDIELHKIDTMNHIFWKKVGIDLMQSHPLHWKNIFQTILGLIGCIGWEMQCYLIHKVQSGGWL